MTAPELTPEDSEQDEPATEWTPPAEVEGEAPEADPHRDEDDDWQPLPIPEEADDGDL